MNQPSGNESDMDDLMLAFDAFTQEFKNRKVYTELNDAVIQTIPDDHIVQAVLDFIGIRIGQDWERDVEKVPPLGTGFSAIYFLSLLETEVNNGGFNQMFHNSGRESVVHAQQGADLLRLEALASLIGQALVVEQAHRDKMAAVKERGTLEAFMSSYEDGAFDDLDDRFFDQAKEIEKTMVAFIRDNASMFSGNSNL